MAKKTRARRKKTSILYFIFRNLYIFVIVIVFVFIVKGIFNIILNSDYFIVKDVQMLCVDKIAQASEPDANFQTIKGINIFKLDLKEYKKQVESARPEFRDININRILPDKIVIMYKKRTPICQLKSVKYYLVSEDMVVLPRPKSSPQPALPIVTGIQINEDQLPKDRRLYSSALRTALRLIQQIRQTKFTKKYKVTTIDVYDERNPIINLDNGIQVKIGEGNFAEKEPLLNQILQDLESKNLTPKSVDLRFEEVVVTPR